MQAQKKKYAAPSNSFFYFDERGGLREPSLHRNQGYVCTSTLPAGATVKKAKVQDPDQKYQVAASVAHTSGYSIGRCRGKCHCSRAMAAAGGAAARGSDVAAAAKATTSPPPASRRGVLMSCPAGGAAHSPGTAARLFPFKAGACGKSNTQHPSYVYPSWSTSALPYVLYLHHIFLTGWV